MLSPCPPHKAVDDDFLSLDRRAAILEKSLEDNAHFQLDLRELTDTTQPSYTIYSVQTIKSEHGLSQKQKLPVILGGDAFLGLATWHRAKELLAECHFLVASRPEYSLEDLHPILHQASWSKIDSPLLQISSSEIRRRIYTSRAWRYLLHPNISLSDLQAKPSA